jgi:3-hydroxybutyrate dehydrogenase
LEESSLVENKVVFITGAARGIGFEIGSAFAENGAKVVLSDLNEAAVSEAAESLKKKGYEAVGIACNVTDEEALKSAIDETLSHFGRLDVLINNAGLQYVSSIEEFPTEKFEQLIQVMLKAPFMAIKHVFPIMKKQQFGRIINMASINGLIGFAGKAAYNSAKHGVIGLTKVAALEGADQGITVNALCPGYVDTPLVRNQLEDLAKNRGVPFEKALEEVSYPLVPQKRLLTVEEIADYALFLASSKGRGITGQAVVIDGGYTAQ